MNSFESPTFGGPMQGYGPNPTEEAIRQLKVPAWTILVMSAITILFRIGGLGLNLVQMGQVPPEQQAFFVGSIIGNVVAMLLNIITVAGAWKMSRAESYGFAMTAAILSVIPVCSPCIILGIPFGIWAIVILMKPEVKGAFVA